MRISIEGGKERRIKEKEIYKRGMGIVEDAKMFKEIGESNKDEKKGGDISRNERGIVREVA